MHRAAARSTESIARGGGSPSSSQRAGDRRQRHSHGVRDVLQQAVSRRVESVHAIAERSGKSRTAAGSRSCAGECQLHQQPPAPCGRASNQRFNSTRRAWPVSPAWRSPRELTRAALAADLAVRRPMTLDAKSSEVHLLATCDYARRRMLNAFNATSSIRKMRPASA